MALFRNSKKLIKISQILTPIRPNFLDQTRNIKRWVAPTLMELKKRKEKYGPLPKEFEKRSNFVEWNYNAELYAFGKRLNEEFDVKLLQQAFINRSFIVNEKLRQQKLGIENPEIDLEDNRNLIDVGDKLIENYVKEYLKYSLPHVPQIGLNEFYKYLTSDDILSNISSNIGIKDLILSSDYPPEKRTLVDTFKAIIGALYKSSGEEKAYTFIRDFVCTQLNQKLLCDIWNIDKPFEMLKEIYKENNLNEPEPRLIGDAGKNTVLAVYHIGMYSNKKLIGTGFGESLTIAVDCAALDALKSFFGFEDSMKPFNFNIGLDKLSKENKQKTLSHK